MWQTELGVVSFDNREADTAHKHKLLFLRRGNRQCCPNFPATVDLRPGNVPHSNLSR